MLLESVSVVAASLQCDRKNILSLLTVFIFYFVASEAATGLKTAVRRFQPKRPERVGSKSPREANQG